MGKFQKTCPFLVTKRTRKYNSDLIQVAPHGETDRNRASTPVADGGPFIGHCNIYNELLTDFLVYASCIKSDLQKGHFSAESKISSAQ